MARGGYLLQGAAAGTQLCGLYHRDALRVAGPRSGT